MGTMNSYSIATQRPCVKHQVPGNDAWTLFSLGTMEQT